MNLAKILKKENIYIADFFEDTDSFYSSYCTFLKKNEIIKDSEKIKRLFVKRENIQSTAIGKSAAAPHIFSDEFSEFVFSVAFIKEGMDFKAPDGNRVFLIFLIMSDERDVGLHLKSLAHIARLISSTDVVESIKKATDANELHKIIAKKEKQI